jgi:hypothetical protein
MEENVLQEHVELLANVVREAGDRCRTKCAVLSTVNVR